MANLHLNGTTYLPVACGPRHNSSPLLATVHAKEKNDASENSPAKRERERSDEARRAVYAKPAVSIGPSRDASRVVRVRESLFHGSEIRNRVTQKIDTDDVEGRLTSKVHVRLKIDSYRSAMNGSLIRVEEDLRLSEFGIVDGRVREE